MFQLTDATPALIASVTPRIEKHGDEDAPAVSIGFEIRAANTILDLIAPGLLATLYRAPDQPAPQTEIEGTAISHYPALRARVIEKVGLKLTLEGWRVFIDHGIDDSTGIDLEACKVDKFRIEPHDGGTVDLFLRVGTSHVDELAMGRLSMLLGCEVALRIIAPERLALDDLSDEVAVDDEHERTATELFADLP